MTDEPIDPNAEVWNPPDPSAYPPPPQYAYQPSYGYPVAPMLPPPPPPPPAQLAGSKQRRTRIIAISASVVVAVTVLAVAITVGTKARKPAGPIVVPAAIGAFQQITDATADRVKAAMQSASGSLSIGQAFLDHTSLGVYRTPGALEPSVILIVGHTDSVPGIQSDNPDQSARLLLEGAIDSPTRYNAGKHGGSVECGIAQLSAAAETLCAWYDGSTVGLLLSFLPAQAPATLAQLANAVRDQVD
jgi:hypothetical protein